MNKIKTIIFACLLLSITNELLAQFPGKYWVKFTDKNGSPYTIGNPSAYLTARSIARRTAQGIAIDITDIPVNQTYINQVNATGAQVFQRSKWMNAAIVIIYQEYSFQCLPVYFLILLVHLSFYRVMVYNHIVLVDFQVLY